MLIKPLLKDADRKRHLALIQNYLLTQFNSADFPVNLIENGSKKAVYKIDLPEKTVLAAAASLNLRDELLREYNVLTRLYRDSPAYFPKPMGHFAGDADLGDLLLMECLEHIDVERYKREQLPFSGFNRLLAYELAYASTAVNIQTGTYASEPHDGNILVKEIGDNKIELKFCDAIQYLDGNLDDVTRSIFSYGDERRECISFAQHFKRGMVAALKDVAFYDDRDAEEEVAFLKKYSGIL